MYLDFFGLSEKPFNLTPDPAFLYLSQSHKEALAHLTYGIEAKSGFVMVTGEVGAGKTTLLRTLIRQLAGDVVLSQVTNTRVGYKELLEMILRDFGVQPGAMGKTALLSMLNDFLIEQYREGRSCVLVIDEAQNLSVPLLEGVRMLSNLETEKSKLLQTILVGQPGLRDLIDSRELEQLRQRITVRYHLGPLSVGEVGEYIRHRMAKVTVDPAKAPIFPDGVIPRIHAATGGIPRLVNVLCDTVLVHAYVAESHEIGSGLIEGVAEQVTQDQQGQAAEGRPGLEPLESKLNAKFAEIEARLESMAVEVSGRGPLSAPLDSSEAAGFLAEKEQELREREQDLRRQAVGLEQRERELSEKLAAIKSEWTKRTEQLEKTRRQLLSGGARQFPALRVHVYDPDPRILNMLQEAVGGAGGEVEVYGDYEAFVEGLRESSSAGWFTVAVLGAIQDDAVNAERVARLAGELPQVPRIYLSDLDLSTLRRRILAAGANYFLEKPNGRNGSFALHREGMNSLRADLLRQIDGIHRQFRAFFETFGAPDSDSDASRLSDG